MVNVVFIASIGLVGCDQVVGEYEFEDEDEFQEAVRSGVIYDYALEAANQYLEVEYRRVED
jgi:hypothetical protein